MFDVNGFTVKETLYELCAYKTRDSQSDRKRKTRQTWQTVAHARTKERKKDIINEYASAGANRKGDTRGEIEMPLGEWNNSSIVEVREREREMKK